jgi:hypothetical protein
VAGRPDGGQTGERPKVIYVMGAGRSGSTILGVALGNSDGVFFAGELDRWLVRGGRPSSEQRARATEFWRRVAEAMGDVSQLTGGPTTSLERSSALLDPRRFSQRRRLRAGYRATSLRLYEQIAWAAGVTRIVDSSHYPLRARELQALEGIDLYLVYLMRDPRDVVASLARHDVRERTFDARKANAYLWLTGALATFVFLCHPRRRRLFVRYEDFAQAPELVLEQILRLSDSDATVAQLAEMDTGVPFHGNRLIDSQTVTFERAGPSSPRRWSLTELAQLPWTAVARWLRPAAGGR